MRKLIVTTLVLLGFAGSALGQHRIVKLNSSQVKGREPKANSITVVWDDGESRHRWSTISLEGRFVTRDVLAPSPESPVRYLDSMDGSVAIFLSGLPHFSFSQEEGDTILRYKTSLIKAGPTTVYYSKELGMDLKAVTSIDDTESVVEAVSIDQQADFDPRTIDFRGIEEAADRAEAGGHKDYARQIRRLVRRWQQAAAKWPSSQSTALINSGVTDGGIQSGKQR